MTADQFRKLALSLPETSESAHMGHPDFRVGGKIFATLGYPDNDWGCFKLTAAQQRRLVQDDPQVYVPAAGAWGRSGMTTVRLRRAKKEVVQQALTHAWCNTAPKPLVRRGFEGSKVREF